MVLTLNPPSGLGVDNAIVEFGYAENGQPGQFYCTSRRETCLATTESVGDIPFLFPSDGAGDGEAGVTGLSCASGCSLAVPALPQRVLYYKVKYRDSNNVVLAETPVQVSITP